jgi:tRNA(Ile)-lysidine synthase
MLTVSQRIFNNIKKYNLFSKDAKIIVGVSGGQDSLCLLHTLLNAPKEYNLDITVVHCDHAWATDEGISDHVVNICKELDVKCIVKVAEGLKETEVAARKWRYSALLEVCKELNCDYVLTGHTLSDQAETVLYNLSRGAGTKGLSGMPWQRILKDEVSLVRPMLSISRDETAKYCFRNELDVWHDVLNDSDDYTRCRIRRNIMPRLKAEVNQAVEANISNTAAIISDEEDYMHSEAVAVYNRCVVGRALFNIKEFQSAHIAIKRRVVKLYLESFCKKSPKYEHISMILDLYHSHKQGNYSGLPNNTSINITGHVMQLKASS